MSINLMEIIGRELTGALTDKLAGAVGVSPQAASSGLGAAIPGILGGLLLKGSSGQGAGDLLGMLTGGAHDGMLGNLAGVLGGGDATKALLQTGGGLLSGIFGGRNDAISGYVAKAAGIGNGASSSLLSLLAPIVLGFITKQLKGSGGLSVSSLMNLLSSQKSALQAAPPGLAGALGLNSLNDLGASAPTIPTPPTGGSLMPWILGLIALGAALFFSRSCSKQETVAPAVEAPPAVTAPAPAPAADGLIDRALPDGTTIRIAADGVEARLLGFIEDASRAVDKTTWFSFDRLEFETGSATLKATSNSQLDNAAAILKAYPNVAVKLGGYTDNTGDASANLTLSGARAQAVMAAVVSRGIAGDRLEAEGYGDQFPVADNATDEGRQKNRRVDVRVTKK